MSTNRPKDPTESLFDDLFDAIVVKPIIVMGTIIAGLLGIIVALIAFIVFLVL